MMQYDFAVMMQQRCRLHDMKSSLKLEIHSTCSFQANCSALPVIESIGGTVEKVSRNRV
jgi:hypothetical protein